ncbi:MAG: hypothetical protein RKO68_08710 [Candidatus Accumulibacter sp.]|nr:hypothetical protein [Accumulibacter sp.]
MLAEVDRGTAGRYFWVKSLEIVSDTDRAVGFRSNRLLGEPDLRMAALQNF